MFVRARTIVSSVFRVACSFFRSTCGSRFFCFASVFLFWRLFYGYVIRAEIVAVVVVVW